MKLNMNDQLALIRGQQAATILEQADECLPRGEALTIARAPDGRIGVRNRGGTCSFGSTVRDAMANWLQANAAPTPKTGVASTMRGPFQKGCE
jgi:hypothetical protein